MSFKLLRMLLLQKKRYKMHTNKQQIRPPKKRKQTLQLQRKQLMQQQQQLKRIRHMLRLKKKHQFKLKKEQIRPKKIRLKKKRMLPPFRLTNPKPRPKQPNQILIRWYLQARKLNLSGNSKRKILPQLMQGPTYLLPLSRLTQQRKKGKALAKFGLTHSSPFLMQKSPLQMPPLFCQPPNRLPRMLVPHCTLLKLLKLPLTRTQQLLKKKSLQTKSMFNKLKLSLLPPQRT